MITHQGIITIGFSNLPIWHSLSWSIDTREIDPDTWKDICEQAVIDARWHPGYRITPPTPRSMNPNDSVDRIAFGLSAGFGTNALAMPGIWYGFVSAPAWAIILVLLLLPIIQTCHYLRLRRRLRRGQCPGCGYDLRASPNRCPECGILVLL